MVKQSKIELGLKKKQQSRLGKLAWGGLLCLGLGYLPPVSCQKLQGHPQPAGLQGQPSRALLWARVCPFWTPACV